MLEELGAYKEVDNIRAAIISDPEVYKKLPVKPKRREEKMFFRTERRPEGQPFSRLDHVMVRHGQQLKELFHTDDENQVLGGIVEAVKNSTDEYREIETGNMVYYEDKLKLTIVVADKKSTEIQPPPPPPYIKTAFTLEGGREHFEYRKSQRGVH